MDIRFSSNYTINVHNRSGSKLYVIATPNKDWSATDVGFVFLTTVVITAASGGSGTAAAGSGITSLAKSVKSAADLYAILNKVRKAYKIMDAMSQAHHKTKYETMLKLLRSSAIEVAPQETKVVANRSMNPFDGLKGAMPSDFVAQYKNALPAGSSEELRTLVTALGTIKQVTSNITTLLSPSVFLSPISDVANVTLFIANEDFSKAAIFHTNNDHSWIVKDEEIVRAKNGTKTEEDRQAGWQIFSNSTGSSLAAGEYLSPNESIDIQTVNFRGGSTEGFDRTNDRLDDTPDTPLDETPTSSSNVDHGGGLTLGEAAKFAGKALTGTGNDVIGGGKGLIGGIAGMVQSIGASPYKLHYRRDGDLALYRIAAGHPETLWSTGTSGRPAWRACMQADGNLVVYSAPGKVEWALWRDMTGQQREGSHIALHPVTGHIGYYASSFDDEPIFFVNEMVRAA